jgi:hypothetical protein
VAAQATTHAATNAVADAMCSRSTIQKAMQVSPYPISVPATHDAGCFPKSMRPSGQPGAVAST